MAERYQGGPVRPEDIYKNSRTFDFAEFASRNANGPGLQNLAEIRRAQIERPDLFSAMRNPRDPRHYERPDVFAGAPAGEPIITGSAYTDATLVRQPQALPGPVHGPEVPVYGPQLPKGVNRDADLPAGPATPAPAADAAPPIPASGEIDWKNDAGIDWINGVDKGTAEAAAADPELAVRLILKANKVSENSFVGREMLDNAWSYLSLYSNTTGPVGSGDPNPHGYGLLAFLQGVHDSYNRPYSNNDPATTQMMDASWQVLQKFKNDPTRTQLSTEAEQLAAAAPITQKLMNDIQRFVGDDNYQTTPVDAVWNNLFAPYLMAQEVDDGTLAAKRWELDQLYTSWQTSNPGADPFEFANWVIDSGFRANPYGRG